MELNNTPIKEFSVVSYNIFFGKLDDDTDADINLRIQLLCAQIQSMNADVVCLQEVLPDRYDKIKSILHKMYPHSYPNKITQTYDTVIFSKRAFLKKSKIKFTLSDMGRSIMWVTIASPFDQNKTIGIATSHLESEFGDNISEQNLKMIQYTEAEDILEQLGEMCETSDIIFCGDFNAHNDLSDATLYKHFKYATESPDKIGWKDVWFETGSNPNSECTFDSTTNPMMMEMYSKLSYPPRYVSRLDRIFHKSSFHAHQFDMIKGDRDFLISDHYPIRAIFRQMPPICQIQYKDYDPDNVSISRTRVRKRASKSISTKLKTVSLFK